MQQSVNELLTICRLSIHFWNEVTGEPDYRDNPGKQLQSWIVATCLDQEQVDLDSRLVNVHARCLEFSRSLIPVVDWLEAEMTHLENYALEFSGDRKIAPATINDLSRRAKNQVKLLNSLRQNVNEWNDSQSEDGYTTILATMIEFKAALEHLHRRFKESGINVENRTHSQV